MLPELGAAGIGNEGEHLAPNQRVQRLLERRHVHPADRGKGGGGEALAEHGRVGDTARSPGDSVSRRAAMSSVNVSGTATSARSPIGRKAPSVATELCPRRRSMRTVSTA